MNQGFRDYSYIGAIRYNMFPDIRTLGNIVMNNTDQLGTPIYSFSLYENEDTLNNDLISLIDRVHKTNEYCFVPTLCIDSKVLHNEEIMSILENAKLYNLRIMDDNYTLTEEDARIIDRLSITTLSVDNSEVDRNYLIIQNNIFKYNLEEVMNSKDAYLKDVYHITHELKDEEYDYLLNNINYSFPITIEIDIHDPSKYESILNKISSYPVSEKLTVRFLGYTLDENEDVYFRNLNNTNFKGNIEVLFHTCHDMIDQYQEEPITFNRSLYSHIEDGGCESLDNYLDMLNNINEVSRFIKENDFSPLEAAIYVKQYFDDNFIYNPDTLTVGQDSDVNIGKIFNSGNTDGKKVAVCLGFASLYSAILRRNGIKCFRYGCDRHSRNVIRLVDEKYGIDKVATIDTTFDLPSDGKDNKYDNFMLSPYDATSLYDTDYYTIPHYLINQPDDHETEKLSVDVYDEFYHPLGDTSSGYGMRMMELMGLCNDRSTLEEIEAAKIKAFDNGLFDRIDGASLASALVRVNNAQGKKYTYEDYINIIMDREDSLNSLDHGPSVVINNDPTSPDYYTSPLKVITKEYSDSWKQTHNNVVEEYHEVAPEAPVIDNETQVFEDNTPVLDVIDDTPVLDEVDNTPVVEEDITPEAVDEIYTELDVPIDNGVQENNDQLFEDRYKTTIDMNKTDEEADFGEFKDYDDYYDYIASRKDLYFDDYKPTIRH